LTRDFLLKIKPNISISNLFQLIEKKYRIKKLNSKKSSIVYLDTFDWRLYRNNFILKYENNLLQLNNINNQKNLHNIEFSQIPILINDIPTSDIKRVLRKIVQIRALQSVGEVVMNKTDYNLLDNKEKIVLRMQIYALNHIGKFISIQALRGYSKQLEILKILIKSKVEETNQKTVFSNILKLNKKQAADYDPRINVQLQPHMKSEIALKLILINLMDTMNKNEQGIIDDFDTEFLHDFRVASRRTRAAVTQIKNIFEPRIVEKINNQFTLLGKKTNKLRDLDVYLLNKDKYIKRLPQNMQTDIEPFFYELQKERKFEVRKFARFLKSESYKNQKNEYNKFLSARTLKIEKAFNADKPIKTLATEFIINQYNKVIKLGNKINSDSPDALYHKLRIQCKKLRYLLEFFSSLFQQEKISLLVAHLKKLQDNLGLFNDLYVQQETLKEDSYNDVFNKDVILALGYLIGKLNDEQTGVRNQFHNSFNEFSNNKNKKLFNELFLINRR